MNTAGEAIALAERYYGLTNGFLAHHGLEISPTLPIGGFSDDDIHTVIAVFLVELARVSGTAEPTKTGVRLAAIVAGERLVSTEFKLPEPLKGCIKAHWPYGKPA